MAANVIENIHKLLVEFETHQKGLEHLCYLTFYDAPDLRAKFDFTGSPEAYITKLIRVLSQHGRLASGEFALVKLMNAAQAEVGGGNEQLSPLIHALEKELQRQSQRPLQSKRKRQAESRNRENLLILLQRVQDDWVEGVFKQSLHNEVLIELGKTRQDDVVDKLNYPFNLTLQSDEAMEQTPILDSTIREIYEEAQQALLILGEPGAGKTMTLLDLTRQLANDATDDANQAIPVVFNLSSWTNKRQSIADWLVDELLTKYRIPKKIGRKWVEDVENHPLVFMLDGLDEVAIDLQTACADAINAFREEYALSGIVVACREKEYSEIATRLKLEQALCVQPLTDEQIAKYLNDAGEDLTGLCAALMEGTTLQELARSPLMLSMMSLAYQNQPLETIRQDVAENAETRQNNLFATYVQHMFQRPRRRAVHYDEQKTRRWLTYLAHNMQQHGQTIFQLENLQPSWLLTKTEFWLYVMLSRLWCGAIIPVAILLMALITEIPVTSTLMAFCIVIVIPIAIPIWLIDGIRLQWTRCHQKPQTDLGWLAFSIFTTGAGVALIFGVGLQMHIYMIYGRVTFSDYASTGVMSLIFGVPMGLFFGLRGHERTMFWDVQILENIQWTWKQFDFSTLLICVLAIIVSIWWHEPLWGFVGMLLFLIEMLGSFRNNIEQFTTRPNEATWLTLKNSLLLGLEVCVIAVIFVGGGWVLLKDKNFLLKLLGLGLFCGLLVAMFFGLSDFLQHFTLRFILWARGHAPWRYARFLNDATDRIFLRKVGGGYIFMHRLLLEYFAAMAPDFFPKQKDKEGVCQ